MTKEEKKDEMKNKISMALKDPILQQGFEIICKNLAELKKENTELKEHIKADCIDCTDYIKNKSLEKENAELVQNKYNLEYKIENLENKIEHHQEVIDTFKKKNAELKSRIPQWHNLQEDPTDLPQCKEDEQIIFYVKEWYEDISKYRNHYCLGFYKKAFLNDDIKVFVEKSKGYENEHLPATVLRWRVLEKWETE